MAPGLALTRVMETQSQCLARVAAGRARRSRLEVATKLGVGRPVDHVGLVLGGI